MANARDELKELEKVVIEDHYKDGWNITLGEVYEEKCIHIDEYLQALEIIVKKDVDVEYLKTCIYSSGFIDIEEYNSYVDGDKELTRKEIELVSKVVKEITEDERK